MGINREKERGSSTNEQKGSHWPEREGRNRGEDGGRREKKRARRESDRECSKRREKPNERGDRTKISQPRAGTAMALFKNLRERGEEVKKVKVCATLRAIPPLSLLLRQPPALHSSLPCSVLASLSFSPLRLVYSTFA